MYKKILIVIIVVIALLSLLASFYSRDLSDTRVSGLRLFKENWSGAITVVGDTYFAPWAKLTIAPGTKVLFEKLEDIPNTDWISHADAYIKDHNDPTGRVGYSKTHFEVSGKIVAIGTKESPIIFTSAQEKPEYADWSQLTLYRGSRLEYVEVSYAHNGLTIWGGGVTVRNSKVHDSLWSGIDIFSTGNLIEGNEVYHTWHQAIGTKKIGPNMIRNNYIHDSNLSVNCENGSRPEIVGNRISAAFLNPQCGVASGNDIQDGRQDTSGGTYNGKLVYPAQY